MNRKDLILRLIKDAGMTYTQATKALSSMIQAIEESLKRGERVTLSGLGSFEVKIRQPRKGRNPKTGEEVPIPERRRVKFNPSKKLRDSL